MSRSMLLAAILCLAGCTASRPASRQFDLGQSDALPPASKVLHLNLIVADTEEPAWMRTRDIFYRLDYQIPARPQRYAINKWIATPAELISLRLRASVQSQNAGYTLSNSGATADYLLQTSLDEFTQSFSTPTQSQCSVQLRASLWGRDQRSPRKACVPKVAQASVGPEKGQVGNRPHINLT